jgi:hypothetical protein
MSTRPKKVPNANSRKILDAQRSKIALRQHRLARSLQALRRLLKTDWNGVGDLRDRLVLARQTLDYFVVDEAMAVSYVKVQLASQDPRVDPDLRQHLRRLCRAALREIQGYARFQPPKGRRPRLSRRQEEQACGAYLALHPFFQHRDKRPVPEHPENQELLAEINQRLEPFAPRRPIRLHELEELSLEIDAGRVAKATVALAFGTSPGTIDKIIARRRPPTPQEPPRGH